MPVEYVSGLSQLTRDFKKISKELTEVLQVELREVAEPVRADAERIAVDEISNIGPTWSQMRVGTTARMVYVAPATRRGRRSKRNPRMGSRRPNLAPLLANAMEESLWEHEFEIEGRLEAMLDRLGTKHGF